MGDFTLSEEEKTKFKPFEEKHGKAHPYTGAIGGLFTYRFFPTSLGCIVKVSCEICDEEIDLTNYDLW